MVKRTLGICQEPSFSQMQDLHRNIANNVNFCYGSNSEKIKNKNIFSPFFGQRNFLLINLAQSHTTSYGLLTPWQNSEKTNTLIPWYCFYICTKGRTDKPYFQLQSCINQKNINYISYPMHCKSASHHSGSSLNQEK